MCAPRRAWSDVCVWALTKQLATARFEFPDINQNALARNYPIIDVNQHPERLMADKFNAGKINFNYPIW